MNTAVLAARSAAPRPALRRRPAVTRAAVTKVGPAPPKSGSGARFGGEPPEEGKLAYVCGSCGFIYNDASKPFEKLPASYKCPVCKAPKNAFSEKAVGGANFLVPILAGLLALGGAAYYCVNNLV